MSHDDKRSDRGALDRAVRTDAGAERPWALAATGGVFLAIAALVFADYLGDARAHGGALHSAVELALSAVAAVAGTILWSRFVALRRLERALARDLDRARAEAERWRADAADALRGLGAAIDAQFERWSLSSAEREIALLLLKGLSHKEIAEVRRTSEKTVRQQSLAVYRKAGLSGRAELSAFFLEDLLLPPAPPARAGGER